MDRGANFQVYLSNLQVKGASNFVIEKLKVNLNDLAFDFIIHLPRLDVRGKYDLKIKLLLADLAGKNELFATFGESLRSSSQHVSQSTSTLQQKTTKLV